VLVAKLVATIPEDLDNNTFGILLKEDCTMIHISPSASHFIGMPPLPLIGRLFSELCSHPNSFPHCMIPGTPFSGYLRRR